MAAPEPSRLPTTMLALSPLRLTHAIFPAGPGAGSRMSLAAPVTTTRALPEGTAALSRLPWLSRHATNTMPLVSGRYAGASSPPLVSGGKLTSWGRRMGPSQMASSLQHMLRSDMKTRRLPSDDSDGLRSSEARWASDRDAASD